MSNIYPDVGSWLSANLYTHYLASNKATVVSVDFPIGAKGSCCTDCDYCYAGRGHQALTRAVELQWIRYQLYRCDPEKYAAKLRLILDRFHERFGFRIGSERFPLRLFGAGDCGNVKTFRRFHSALERHDISSYGYSRFFATPGDLFYSADNETSPTLIARAKREGRRVAFVRQPGDVVPNGVDLVFPEHKKEKEVPLNSRDCPKIRHPHERGVCLDCKRCFARAQTATAAA